MKAVLMTILGCTTILMSGYTLAWSDDEGGCGSCGSSASICDPYQSRCECTDPLCNSPADSDCRSRGYCCEAFGNVGGR